MDAKGLSEPLLLQLCENAWTKRDSTYSRIELLGELQNACDDNLGMGHHNQVILRMANKGTGSIGP